MAEIALTGVNKLYGGHGKAAQVLVAQGLDKAAILERTGCTVALRDIDLVLPSDAISVIMGLSGSGKSTLLRCLIRLIDPSSGAIRFDGEDITRLGLPALRAFRRTHVAMVFQNFALLPHRTVLQNAAFGLALHGVKRGDAEARAAAWLAKLGLGGYERAYPDALSGGMRQRVGLARALACDPDVLLMDEAFSALDPLIRDELQAQLLDLQAELGKTIVFVTHDIREALRLGAHIVVMRDGRVEQAGPPATLLSAPSSDYVARFVAQAAASAR
ncbi:ATP-binding cassette domain-containing protein [Sphingomonas abietis]|uniref:ATP-binding cassette domain-containing protein n=1 Tax=Sphingomonas abietis TaxID=3012344 RepID=A0ABY7NQD5_9SPHN|nr:ATP-binding cassette domain-containing protein [Sphingomonas abietis]WBO23754.1 ATP-binding cassette domain-containing protein [Sphingomonas abietis]